MENFEGGRGNPEIKSKKLGLGARLKLAAAIALGTALPLETGISKPEIPNEIHSGEPPKPEIRIEN